MTISQVLAEIANCRDPFLLDFVRSTGKEAGAIKRVHCLYGAPNPRDRGQAAAPTSVAKAQRLRRLHIESGTIPLTEVSNGRMCTPRISHIIGFNGKKVYH